MSHIWMSSYVYTALMLPSFSHMHTTICVSINESHICTHVFIYIQIYMDINTRHTYELMPHIWMSSYVYTALMLPSSLPREMTGI